MRAGMVGIVGVRTASGAPRRRLGSGQVIARLFQGECLPACLARTSPGFAEFADEKEKDRDPGW
jgi:hypothetical protein